MILCVVSKKNTGQGNFEINLRNALSSIDWNLQKKRPKYWSAGGLSGKTGKEEDRDNQTPLIFLALRFIAEWTDKSIFSVVE